MTTDLRAPSFGLVGISKCYQAVVALHPTDLAIQPAEYLVLLGPSGSGKTTLLMILAGFVKPTAGNVLRDDVAITHVPPERRGFGVVFQGYALFPHLSVAENVAFALNVRGVPRLDVESRVNKTLDLMRLRTFADRLPKQLSGGQQQRVALARALAFNPSLLLLDEPMSALDRKLKEELQAELKEVHQQVGTTFVHITHDQDEAMSLADRVAVMHDGKIVQLGAPRELYQQPGSRFVAGFLGKSNFIDGVVERVDGDIVAVRARNGALIVAMARTRRTVGEAVTIAVRPENICAAPAGAPRETDLGLRGVVISQLFFGKYTSVQVHVTSLDTIVAHVPTDRGIPAAGGDVLLTWPTQHGVVLDA
ncbi:MAG: ABC transporter ATP-binding protein [Caldimonas sp.]